MVSHREGDQDGDASGDASSIRIDGSSVRNIRRLMSPSRRPHHAVAPSGSGHATTSVATTKDGFSIGGFFIDNIGRIKSPS